MNWVGPIVRHSKQTKSDIIHLGTNNYLDLHILGVIRDSTKLFEEYGMPSSHSQFMWFVSV